MRAHISYDSATIPLKGLNESTEPVQPMVNVGLSSAPAAVAGEPPATRGALTRDMADTAAAIRRAAPRRKREVVAWVDIWLPRWASGWRPSRPSRPTIGSPLLTLRSAADDLGLVPTTRRRISVDWTRDCGEVFTHPLARRRKPHRARARCASASTQPVHSAEGAPAAAACRHLSSALMRVRAAG